MSGGPYAFDGAAIAQRAAAAISALPPGSPVSRAVVLGTTESTQDDARQLASAGGPGVVVFAEHQTKGRGRLGRAWADISMKSLPATFAIGGGLLPEQLSLAAGVAASLTIESLLQGRARVGIRWPNDVVEWPLDASGVPGRKLCGVLIEAAGTVHLVGIGINVTHDDADWPQELAATACSLRQLGCNTTRAEVTGTLITQLVQALAMPAPQLIEHWRRRNVLLGQTRAFTHNAATYTGVVRDIDPANEIVLEKSPGQVKRLPALTTSMVK
ncbi:MAG: biotin--[acetyl-CoA-carboxylase] ligase [Phycisphaerales bacterium]|jgi:BirA family biotin operon repressor/biotin-[acetyl-CoA-carboxylase] ligase